MLALLTLSTLLLNKCYSTIIEHNSIGVTEHIREMMDENNATRGPEDLVRRLLPGGFTAQDKLKVLQTHNKYRSLTAQGLTQGQPGASNMNELLWDDALAKVAQDYSSKCTWAHNSNRVTDLSNNIDLASFDYTKQTVGENLFLSSGSESIDTILQGIQYWYSEYTYYTYGTLSTSGSCQSGQQCGHYTQLVWGNTRYVGCGYTKCPSVSGASFKNSMLFVCNYYFAGNVIGSYPYKSGTSATSCSSDRTPQDNLCTGCPNPSWDSYCCEYCSPASCLAAKTANLLNSPASCTDGLGNVLLGSGSDSGSEPSSTPTPTNAPTPRPTTSSPTPKPTTSAPTPRPTNTPTARPTNTPTARPTNTPTARPTNTPTARPTNTPTSRPTNGPTSRPTNTPTARPTNTPTARPTNPSTSRPTNGPTSRPTNGPTSRPTNTPTSRPTNPPTDPATNSPTAPKTNYPTARSLGSSRKDTQTQLADDSCCSATNSRYAFFCQSITQEELCRTYTEVCSWDDSC